MTSFRYIGLDCMFRFLDCVCSVCSDKDLIRTGFFYTGALFTELDCSLTSAKLYCFGH